MATPRDNLFSTLVYYRQDERARPLRQVSSHRQLDKASRISVDAATRSAGADAGHELDSATDRGSYEGDRYRLEVQFDVNCRGVTAADHSSAATL